MTTQFTGSPRGGGMPPGTPAHSERADNAYRRAWWSLALYPLSFVAAFVIGEGILSLLDADSSDPAIWQVFVAATPALAVFVIPGTLAVLHGRKAARLGHPSGMVPAIVGATIGLGFVLLNVASYLLGLAVSG